MMMSGSSLENCTVNKPNLPGLGLVPLQRDEPRSSSRGLADGTSAVPAAGFGAPLLPARPLPYRAGAQARVARHLQCRSAATAGALLAQLAPFGLAPDARVRAAVAATAGSMRHGLASGQGWLMPSSTIVEPHFFC